MEVYMQDIKAKIDEMERISKEIQDEITPARLYFSWTMSIHGSEIDRVALGLNVQFNHLREELYGDLIKAGVLPEGSGLVDGSEPGGR
jgi:hypothetical protein